MSDKSISYKSRRNSGRKKHGSGFPRHCMDYYAGSRLGMSKHIVRRGNVMNAHHNHGYLHGTTIEKLVIKYIGKPYSDLVNHYYKITKKHRDKHKEFCWISELDFYFDKTGRWCRGDYWIDNEGLVQKCKYESRPGASFTKEQVLWNSKQTIPDFGEVALPREFSKSKGDYWCTASWEYRIVSFINRGDEYKPKLLGKFYCIIGSDMLLLPVYHLQAGGDYHEYTYKCWENSTYKYLKWGSYPKKWNTSDPSEKYSDLYRVGTSPYYQALSMENTWIVPEIMVEIGKRRSTPLKFRSDVTKMCPNPKIQALKMNISSAKFRLKNEDMSDSTRIDLIKDCADMQKELITLPLEIPMNVGYGQLYTLVKRTDYELALKNKV